MFSKFKEFLDHRAQAKVYQQLAPARRQITFYSEGAHDWPHLGPLVQELATVHEHPVAYLTSDANDPVFCCTNPNITAFNIGSGAVRTMLFRAIDASVVVMTLPDLDRYHLKRPVFPVHYMYVFHSLNSTHMVYRKGAFDAYDTILCTGPHHVTEIRRTEEVYGLKAKNLVEHGYARLDHIIEHASAGRSLANQTAEKSIVLAPSWGSCSFVEHTTGPVLLESLLAAGHALTIRLHPMTVRNRPDFPAELAREFSHLGQLTVETDMHSQESLQHSDLMISDWSGSALEYAFGLERPVLFVDTPAKVNNPEWEKLGLATIQATARHEIGEVLALAEVASAANKVTSLCADAEQFKLRARDARTRWVFHIGESAKFGACAILRQISRPT